MDPYLFLLPLHSSWNAVDPPTEKKTQLDQLLLHTAITLDSLVTHLAPAHPSSKEISRSSRAGDSCKPWQPRSLWIGLAKTERMPFNRIFWEQIIQHHRCLEVATRSNQGSSRYTSQHPTNELRATQLVSGG